MKNITENENVIIPSYNKKKITNRLVELKSRYQDLLKELKDSSIDNIDKVFGYNNNVDETDSDAYLREINENLELQDKIRILKQNISTKMKNIEKINSLNLDSKSYSDLKNQISESFEIIKDSYLDNSQNKNIGINNDAIDLLVKKIEKMQEDFDEKISKLYSNLSIKDESIYKDEVEFLKNQIDSLLIENHECKAKLSELITISNLKEDEINKSYSAWLQNSSKLNELEYLLVDQKEKLDVLDNEKNEAIDLLANKIKAIKNDDQFYNKFNDDLINNNLSNDSILKTIESKLDLIKEELLNKILENKETSNYKNNDFVDYYRETELIDDNSFLEKELDFISNINNNYSNLLNRFNELLLNIDNEIEHLIKPAFIPNSDPSFEFDDLKNNIKDVDELVNSNLENFHNSKQIFNKLQNILNLNDLLLFLKDSNKSINNLNKKMLFSKNNWEEHLHKTNNKIINDKLWFNLNDFINKIFNSLNEMNKIIEYKINSINNLDLNVLLEENMSKSNFWFCFMEAINLLNEVIDNQFDDFVSIKSLFNNEQNNIPFNFKENNDFINKNNEIQNELFSLINNKTISEEERNKRLKIIYKKLQNLERMIDLYEVNEFEKMVDNLN